MTGSFTREFSQKSEHHTELWTRVMTGREVAWTIFDRSKINCQACFAASFVEQCLPPACVSCSTFSVGARLTLVSRFTVPPRACLLRDVVCEVHEWKNVMEETYGGRVRHIPRRKRTRAVLWKSSSSREYNDRHFPLRGGKRRRESSSTEGRWSSHVRRFQRRGILRAPHLGRVRHLQPYCGVAEEDYIRMTRGFSHNRAKLVSKILVSVPRKKPVKHVWNIPFSMFYACPSVFAHVRQEYQQLERLCLNSSNKVSCRCK